MFCVCAIDMNAFFDTTKQKLLNCQKSWKSKENNSEKKGQNSALK